MQTRIDRIPASGVNFDEGFLPVQIYLVPYLVHIGFPEITIDCKADITTFSKTHFKNWLNHPLRAGYIRRHPTGGKFELNKQGWEELLRVANVKVDSKLVKLVKIRGVE